MFEFAEIHVDCDICEIWLQKLLGVFSAGRILNHKTARSQLLGGMVWGQSYTFLERMLE
ncbi:MAG TPA: hypothetical protein ENH62_10280 [Marinobacter sp.]|uniref:Aldehyde oxidase/xanthine dehydrogenase second molybdopterin binding domain-containing protein n=1 Tax=Marinobacter antarcticus TaxID=564117 RepID=A0A831R4E2_9GAMM|nr:molybdopterin cofactor-binding domain-containing protein [Marinobacter antarcticus]HDZ38657.1 hypothetical protein [Marinobacter sp.]HEA52059.1 hypothetical protein [Marinobacter antarcticus]